MPSPFPCPGAVHRPNVRGSLVSSSGSEAPSCPLGKGMFPPNPPALMGREGEGVPSSPAQEALPSGIRYGRPPCESLGSKRKGIDGRAHKEWSLRLNC